MRRKQGPGSRARAWRWGGSVRNLLMGEPDEFTLGATDGLCLAVARIRVPLHKIP